MPNATPFRESSHPAGADKHRRRLAVSVPMFLALLVAALPARAQAPPEIFATRSVSGQFIVQVAPGAQYSFGRSDLETNRNFIRLDPTLVPVSCERIKQILCRQLDTTAPYSGKVLIAIYPGRGAGQPIGFNAEQFRDGWQYRVMLPNVVERVRYVRTMVQVILLEMANRAATDHRVEVPLWLTEGLTQELLASREIEIILPPPSTPANDIRLTYTPMDRRRPNPLERAHQVLSTSTPLTFQQLSWPPADQLEGAGGEVFSSSAQLFVHQLLNFREGGACLRRMVIDLPKYYNWQFAFLDAFQPHFHRPLDIEKWWRLELVHFTGRDLDDAWSADNSWQKLEQTIHPVIQLRTGTNELPLRAEVSLQTVIRDWDPARQPAALQAKLHEFASLRLRIAKDLVPLLDEYRQVISNYLEARQHPGLFRKKAAAREAVQTAVRQLDALDARLERLRPPEKAAVQADASQRR